MKFIPYPFLLFLVVFPALSNGMSSDTTRLILSVTNASSKPVMIQAGDWQHLVQPGKTDRIDEQLYGVSIPYTITVSVQGLNTGGQDEAKEIRILDDGKYADRKMEIDKDGHLRFQSVTAEMDWFWYTQEINKETVYPSAEKLIKKDPDSPAATDILALYICRARFSADSIEALYSNLSHEQQASPRGRIVSEYINSRRALLPGKIMQDFQLPDSSGKLISLYSIRSKYILIDFWFSTCKPCIEAFPELISLYNKTTPENLTIIGISVDAHSMLPGWKATIRKYKLPWINLSDPGYSIPYYRYGIEQYPTQVLLDSEWRIIDVNRIINLAEHQGMSNN